MEARPPPTSSTGSPRRRRRAYGRVIPARAEGVYAARDQGAGRPGRRLHAVELPDQPGGPQDLGARSPPAARSSSKAPEETPASCAELDPRLPRRRRAGRRAQPRLRRAGRDLRVPHPAPGDPQGHLHRLDAGRQAARRARRPAHEAGHDGARRPRAGDRLRRRRRRARRRSCWPAAKFRNAGQVCVVADPLPRARDASTTSSSTSFVAAAKNAQGRRRPRPDDARWARSPCRAASRRWRASSPTPRPEGAELRTGGKRIGNQGFFFEPTVLTDVPHDARIMNEEPFGPIAAITPLRRRTRRRVEEANRLPYGLAAYAYTRSAKTADDARGAGRERHDLDQPPRPRPARGAVRRRQGLRLRLARAAPRRSRATSTRSS